MVYCVLKYPKGGEKFPAVLPKREYLKIGDYVTFAVQNGEEKVAVVSVPEFDAEETDVVREWGKPRMVTATLKRFDVEWPVDMDEQLPEIEG